MTEANEAPAPNAARLAEWRQAEKTTVAFEHALRQAAAAGPGPGRLKETAQIARELYLDHVVPIRNQLDQLAARVAELEAERADTGTTHRELLARTYCAVCGNRRTSSAHITGCLDTEGV